MTHSGNKQDSQKQKQKENYFGSCLSYELFVEFN